MKKDLLKVSIRQHAIYLPAIEGTEKREALTSTTVTLVAQLRKVGYSLSEELLHAVNQLYPAPTGVEKWLISRSRHLVKSKN